MNTHSTTSNEGWQDIATAPEVVRDLYEALKGAPIPGAQESMDDFRERSDAWLNGPYRAALRKAERVQP